MRKIALLIMLILAGLAPISVSAQEEARHADHEALRAILKTSSEAINTTNFDSLKPILSKDHFSVITVDNHKFESLDEFKNYWDQLFHGPNAVLESIQINPTVDKPTEFFADNVGVAQGVSNDVYHFKDGDTRPMQTRWTAVVDKEDGVWKIVKIHFSADVMDNPVLYTAEKEAKKYVGIAAVGGFILGLLVMGMIRRRKTA